MTSRHEVSLPKSTMVGCTLLLFAACSSGSDGGATGGAQAGQSSTSASSAGGSGGTSSGGASASSAASSSSGGGPLAGASSTSKSGGSAAGGQTTAVGGSSKSGGQPATTGGTTGSQAGGTTSGGTGGTGGNTGGASGQAGSGGAAGQTGNPGVDGGLTSPCTGKEWPTADPTATGPFKVIAEKKVGPLAGYTPDPIYENEQQHFNIYRPENLKDSGYCHPILVWANGHTDNPEPNPPKCVVDSGANKWCGQYLPLMNHLAAHGFVVIASLSTTTSKGDPLPTKVGLDWLLQQAEDPNNTTYYHRLDTAHIGQLGHSEGGMSTCMSAKEPRYSAIATVSGTATITGIHTPALFFCGGKENGMCDNNLKVASSITDQPAMLINALNADHGSWVYEGTKGVALSGFVAWFRLHLMGDTAQRKRFYGEGCTFCTDSRAKVLYRSSVMTQ